ncbi:MAG: hypothetical protein R6V03_02030 [Kiritimatiellia bacterium]
MTGMAGSQRWLGAQHSISLAVAALAILRLAGLCHASSDTIVPRDQWVSDEHARAIVVLCEAEGGNEKAARDSYYHLLSTSNLTWGIRLQLAEIPLSWGDYASADRIYNEYLETHADDCDILARRAAVLAAAQQYERAEGLTRRCILHKPDNVALLLQLADIKRAGGEFSAALKILEDLPSSRNSHYVAAVLEARGKILLNLKEWVEARATYKTLSGLPDRLKNGLTGLGLCDLGQGEKQTALGRFEAILQIDPSDISARFYKLLCAGDEPGSESFLKSVHEGWSIPDLIAWAELCSKNGDHPGAIRTLRHALTRHPASYVVRLNLARTLASRREFDEALDVYRELNADFSNSYTAQLEWARTLSWAKEYDVSLDLYARLVEQDPKNVVPGRERARVAVWAKRMDTALQFYSALLEPSVDSLLATELAAAGSAETPAIQDVRHEVKERSGGRPYDAYEWLFVEGNTNALDAVAKERLGAFRMRHLAAYRIQKAIYLEKEEKDLAENKRYWRAAQLARQLVDFAPGNQEAVYDLSQLQFALGLEREAVRTTEKLYRTSPNHNIAPEILETAARRQQPYILGNGSYWHEEGRGDLIDITRLQYGLGVGVPILQRGHLEAAGRYWDERPRVSDSSYEARGVSLRGHGVLLPWLVADGSLALKDYLNDGIDDTRTGHIECSANVRDWAKLTLRRERTDELYNKFGLEQNTQADSWVLKGHSFLTRDLEMTATGQIMDYSDGNRGEQVYANLAYSLTDHPRILKAAVFGETRDTDHETEYVDADGTLTDVVYPYWTPVDYQAWGIMLEWRHDISPIFARGTDHRYYDVLVTLRDDSEENPTVEIKGQLHVEFRKRWLIGCELALIRSEQWDGEGLWLTVKRHF